MRFHEAGFDWQLTVVAWGAVVSAAVVVTVLCARGMAGAIADLIIQKRISIGQGVASFENVLSVCGTHPSRGSEYGQPSGLTVQVGAAINTELRLDFVSPAPGSSEMG